VIESRVAAQFGGSPRDSAASRSCTVPPATSSALRWAVLRTCTRRSARHTPVPSACSQLVLPERTLPQHRRMPVKAKLNSRLSLDWVKLLTVTVRQSRYAGGADVRPAPTQPSVPVTASRSSSGTVTAPRSGQSQPRSGTVRVAAGRQTWPAPLARLLRRTPVWLSSEHRLSEQRLPAFAGASRALGTSVPRTPSPLCLRVSCPAQSRSAYEVQDRSAHHQTLAVARHLRQHPGRVPRLNYQQPLRKPTDSDLVVTTPWQWCQHELPARGQRVCHSGHAEGLS
jgi:hypothetical protein